MASLVKLIMLESVMFYNKKILIFFLLIIVPSNTGASVKNDIIQNLKNTNNLTFKFEQNINGKIEDGECSLEYPKKIFCKYNLDNQKVLVSNGRSVVIKTSNSYYIYPLKETALNLILNKDFLLRKIQNLDEITINKKFVNFRFVENDNEINLFFDKNTHNLIGWQTLDIYQNLSITYINSIIRNKDLEENLFKLPAQN